MDQAVTVGGIVWTLLAIGAVVGVLGLCAFVLSVIASGFNH